MFIFCNYKKGHEILKLLKKIYKFAPQTSSPSLPSEGVETLRKRTLSNSSQKMGRSATFAQMIQPFLAAGDSIKGSLQGHKKSDLTRRTSKRSDLSSNQKGQ